MKMVRAKYIARKVGEGAMGCRICNCTLPLSSLNRRAHFLDHGIDLFSAAIKYDLPKPLGNMKVIVRVVR